MTTTTTCGHDSAAFGTIHRLDALGIAAQSCGLFGTCLDGDAAAEVIFTVTSRGTTGTASLT